MCRVSLGDVEGGRFNNLNLIRFILASGVIYTHSFTELRLASKEPVFLLTNSFTLGTLAVWSFFFISGYLILKSSLRSTPERFITSRILRIFPGLIAIVLLCTFLLGPAKTTLSLSAYFRDPTTHSFLTQMWLHRTRLPLPGVFTGPRDTTDVVPTLWTLPGEWTMYVATMLACLIFRWKQLPALTKVSWFSVGASVAFTIQMFPLATPEYRSWVKYFVLGALCYLLRRRIWLSVPAAVICFSISLYVFVALPRIGKDIFPCALGYLLLAIGFHPGVCVKTFHWFGDYSYGLYIYAFPLQQLCVNAISNTLYFFALTYSMTLLIAILSWHFMEQPFLRLKKRAIATPTAETPVSALPIPYQSNA